MCFFNLIKQYDTVRLPADFIGELPTIIVAYVSSRRTN